MVKQTSRAERRRGARPVDAPAPAPARTSGPPAPNAPEPPPPPTGPSRFETLLTEWWTLPAILIVAAVFRLWHLMALAQTPFFDHLGLDPLVYEEWGQRIAAGDWIGSRIYYQDPLYPYFLGVIYSIFGRHLMLVYLIQVAFGVATCWLTALLGRRVFSPAAGNLAALIAAVFGPSIFYEVQIEKTFLSVFLVAACLVLVLASGVRARFGAGVVLALAVLTRANLIVFIPLALALAAFERPAAGDAPPRYDFWRKPEEWGLRRAAAFLAGCALVLTPVAARNYYVEGQLVLTTSQAGQNFYIGNNPLNTTGSYYVPPSIRPDPRYEETDFRAEAEKKSGRKLTATEVSDYWSKLAWDHISANPTFAQMMFLRKFVLFWNDYEVPDNLNIYLLERWSWVLRLPLLGIGVITAFALLGGAVAFRENTSVRVLAGFVAIYCATVVAFYVFSRYRIQIVPVLMVLAAHGILWLVWQLRARRWEYVAGGVAAVLMAGFFCFQRFEWTDRTKAIAISLNNLGALYMDMGETAKAISTYEEAVSLSPQGVIGAMRILGDYYMKQGNFGRAEELMRKVVTYKPESQMGWNALATLYAKKQAAGDEVDEELVEALIKAGRVADARRAVESARAAGRTPSEELTRKLAAAEAGKR